MALKEDSDIPATAGFEFGCPLTTQRKHAKIECRDLQ